MRKLRRILFLKMARLFRGEKNIVPCIISSGTKIKGDILDGDIIHIDGKLEGNISCKELIIGKTGVLNGNAEAKVLELYGELHGKIKAESLFISGTAKFVGDSIYNTIAIEPGAVLVGTCSNNGEHKNNEKKESSPRLVA